MNDGFVLMIHPTFLDDLVRGSAREQWYAQHRENRVAKREGREPRDIKRLLSPGQIEFFGVRFVAQERIA